MVDHGQALKKLVCLSGCLSCEMKNWLYKKKIVEQ